MKKVRFAVIGMGHIGKRHAEMIRRNEQAELIAVCDILSQKELKYPALSENFYNSLSELLANEKDIDVVNICVPNGLHAELALKALDWGKHVVIEKPMALSKQDAEEILSKSKEVGRDVFCVMQNRYSPPSVWLKEVVESGILGKLYSVQLNCFWNRDERYYKQGNWHGTTEMDGGTLFTQFSHFVDIMYWLFGDITNIKASFQDFNHQLLTAFEDSGSVLFDFVKGGSGSLNYSTAVWDKNLESSLTIIAENGSIKVAGQYMNEVDYCYIKDYSMPKLTPSNPPNDYGVYKGSAQNHHYVIQNVIDKLNGNALITTNAMDGLKVVDIIERIYKERDTQ
ncbi:Gfo/Idh/MocA family oxidoreductase [uncultured Bacteroides sp.]|uniref:Gfo/Idh/MocA family protein n=1 Tax=uncultured Bacteroides sp. TaxID=162156 RepID=UPI002AAB5E77|nr:Gfo/Idh/MocA family oxidoreductase [uncultured Bacteroides sp.]